jgi:hypothetical protein
MLDPVVGLFLTAAGGLLATLYWRLRERSRRRTELAKIKANAKADVKRIRAWQDLLLALKREDTSPVVLHLDWGSASLTPGEIKPPDHK